MAETRLFYIDLAMRSKFTEIGQPIKDTRAVLEGVWVEVPELSIETKLEVSAAKLAGLSSDDGYSESFIEVG